MTAYVETYLTGCGLDRPDGFAFDPTGSLWVANWGGGAGRTLLKIDSPQSVRVVDDTCDAPDALAFDQAGNVYISNYNSGVIARISPAGVKTEFAAGLVNPSALAFDQAGNLYVSNFGGGSISRITPAGEVGLFVSGFSAPLGLVFAPTGSLFVADYRSGSIHKVTPDQSVSVFAIVPDPASARLQYLVRGPSGCLYLPAYGHHRIYRIDPDGNVAVFAGRGSAGGQDGPLDQAEFDGPNSIAIGPHGDLYISEYNPNRIRVIRGAEL